MRLELLYNPRAIIERLAVASQRRRRTARLGGTVAAALSWRHIESLELLDLALPAPRVIYDVGANVGTWTLLAKSLFPGAELHAFEPLAEHCTAFERATAALRDVRLHRVALGTERATLPLKVTSFSDASSLLEVSAGSTERFGVSLEREEPVPVERLDEYAETQGLPAPDVIKLDVQGYELAVLRGGERCLARARHVLTEVSFVDLYHGQAFFHDVVAYLHERGLHLRALGVNTPLGAPLTQTDALFSRD